MEEQVLTIDVVPQTVTEVIYLNPQDINFEKTVEVESYYSSSSEDHENENETYEIGCVDATQVEDMPLVYDQSESFVMLPELYQIEKKKTEQNEGDNSETDEEYILPTKRKKVTCHVCKMKFFSRKKLFQHRVLHKSNVEGPVKTDRKVECIYKTPQEVLICKVCGEKFGRTQALSIHFRKNHQTTPINTVPQAHSSNNRELSSHESMGQNCNEPPKHFCTICGCPCVNEIALLFHYKKHEPKVYSCNLCEAGYNDENDFLNHKKTHNVQFLYACNKCDESFPTTALVSYHIRHVHAKCNSRVANLPDSKQRSTNVDVNEFLHNINSSLTDSSTSQLEHSKEKTQMNKRKYSCNICNSKFHSQGALTRHKTQHIPNLQEGNNVSLI